MTKPTGLSHSEARTLLHQHGPNTLVQKEQFSFVKAFLQQFIDPMMFLLICAAALISFIGDPSDAYLIIGILLFNGCIGTLQERRISKLIYTVENHETEYALVYRDNSEIIIKASDLVPGDYIIIQQGEQVHADVSIMYAENLSVNEAVITGEHYPVTKTHGDILFKGSFINTGIVHATIIATGNNTRVGKLHTIAQKIALQTPLQKDLTKVIHIILGGVIVICISLLGIGIINHRPFPELFAAIVALFICVVPQGLPVIMTLILASSAFALLKRRFFVKKMSAVDGLARAQVIIFDKTGTLTTNEFTVDHIITESANYYTLQAKHFPSLTLDDSFDALIKAIALLEYPQLSSKTTVIKGNATDIALCNFIEKLKLDTSSLYHAFVLSSSSVNIKDRRIISRCFLYNNEKILFMMGAPEQIIKYSHITPEIHEQYRSLLDQGLRVIAVAQKVVKPNDTLIQDAAFLGFVGITENIRYNASSIIQKLKDAGIKTMIATGDKKETALFVAHQTGILTDDTLIYDGTASIDKTTDVLEKQLFYRMTPEKKITLIKNLQAQNLSVAMIGDGFNDAPAVAIADTGIALGARAADITKQAASALLLDDGFEHLISIIAQGRHVFMSFKRVILYFFTTNFSEILIVVYAFCFHLPLPLLAPHILWLNLITDGFLDSSLALEPHNSKHLEKEWFQNHTQLADTFLVGRIIYQALLVTTIAAWLFTTHYTTNLVHAQTLCLAAMTLCQCAMAINCRSFDKSLCSIGLFSNKMLVGIIGGIIVGLIVITSTPWGNVTFKTVSLSSYEWVLLGLLSFSLIIMEEIRKYIIKFIIPYN